MCVNFKLSLSKSCFGNNLDPDYLMYLERFEEAFHNLGYPETLKVYAMLTHIAHFLADKNHGLGVRSEQAFEGVHYDYNEH